MSVLNPSTVVGDIALVLQDEIQKVIDRKLSLLDVEVDKSVCLLLVAVAIQEVLAEMLLAKQRSPMVPDGMMVPPISTIEAAITVTSVDVLAVTMALRNHRKGESH